MAEVNLSNLRRKSVIVVKPIKNGYIDNVVLRTWNEQHAIGGATGNGVKYVLIEGLMWSGVAKVGGVLVRDSPRMSLVQKKGTIQTLASNAAWETLAGGVSQRRLHGSAEHLDVHALADRREPGTELVIIVPIQKHGLLSHAHHVS